MEASRTKFQNPFPSTYHTIRLQNIIFYFFLLIIFISDILNRPLGPLRWYENRCKLHFIFLSYKNFNDGGIPTFENTNTNTHIQILYSLENIIYIFVLYETVEKLCQLETSDRHRRKKYHKNFVIIIINSFGRTESKYLYFFRFCSDCNYDS